VDVGGDTSAQGGISAPVSSSTCVACGIFYFSIVKGSEVIKVIRKRYKTFPVVIHTNQERCAHISRPPPQCYLTPSVAQGKAGQTHKHCHWIVMSARSYRFIHYDPVSSALSESECIKHSVSWDPHSVISNRHQLRGSWSQFACMKRRTRQL
jgi:hypothetical protein